MKGLVAAVVALLLAGCDRTPAEFVEVCDEQSFIYQYVYDGNANIVGMYPIYYCARSHFVKNPKYVTPKAKP